MTRMSRILAGLVALLVPAVAGGFSPYENYLLSGRATHVGLLAKARDGHAEDLAKALAALGDAGTTAALARAGIDGLGAFRRAIDGGEWFVVTFAYAGGREYLTAAAAFEQAAPATAALAGLIEPHERAGRFGTQWLQMEWINYIRGKDVPGPAASRIMIVTTIRPEMERDYRALHQTVWPGVVDQLIRSNNRNLSIFLATVGGRLVEFLHLEHVGADAAADEAMSKSDEVNLRWWRLTDACQEPLPGVEGIWDLMVPVAAPAAVSGP